MYCDLCEREVAQDLGGCQYINCPQRKKRFMPVRATVKRTLWTLPPTHSTSNAHEPFASMFTRCIPLEADSLITPEDVVFFDGGTDVDPALYGELPHVATGPSDRTRDKREKEAFVRAQAVKARCFGVCRGAQFLCVMSGGKLVQHVSGHQSGHMIIANSGDAIYSESSHHQVMWPYEIPHVLIAWADQNAQQRFVVSDEYGKTFEDDRLPEMIYCKDTRSLCIQGHTEWMSTKDPFSSFTKQLVREFLF